MASSDAPILDAPGDGGALVLSGQIEEPPQACTVGFDPLGQQRNGDVPLCLVQTQPPHERH
eukprot:9182927-Lingulodinium_polyedra.AAC.1